MQQNGKNTAAFESKFIPLCSQPVNQSSKKLNCRFFSQSSEGEKKEYLFKVLVIGDLGVGKTSIIKRYVHQFFSVHYRATVSLIL